MLQYPPFLFFHDRCQLLQITDHQQLYPAERFAPVSVAAEHITHRIQQICPDHTDLIDNQQIHAPDNIDFFPSEFMVKPFLTRAVFFGSTRNIRSERQLKKRMDGDSPGIDRSHSGRGNYNHPFGRTLLQFPQKRRFSGKGLTGQKNTGPGIFQKIKSKL